MNMLKLLTFTLVVLFMSSCGVSTSSSDTQSQISDANLSDGNNDSGYLINPNPVSGEDTTGGDTTGGDTTGGDTTGGDTTGGDTNSIFDTLDAVEDKYACMIGDPNDGYTNNSVADTAFDNQGEEDVEDGIGINSRFPYNNDILKTEVRVYYYDLKPSRTMTTVSKYEADFRLTVDTGWANNDETKLYVRTPKDENGLYGCYRYELSSIDTNNASLVGTKVYRNEI